MYRILGSGLGFCIVFAAALGLEVRADAIQMTMTGNAGFGPVNYTQVLSNSVLETGFSDLTLGSRTVGAIPSGSIDAPISLTIGLSDLDAPGSQGLTLSLSGTLTGQFIPYNLSYGILEISPPSPVAAVPRQSPRPLLSWVSRRLHTFSNELARRRLRVQRLLPLRSENPSKEKLDRRSLTLAPSSTLARATVNFTSRSLNSGVKSSDLSTARDDQIVRILVYGRGCRDEHGDFRGEPI